MEITVTAKVLIQPTKEQTILLTNAGRAFSCACDYVSSVVFDTHNLSKSDYKKKFTIHCVLLMTYHHKWLVMLSGMPNGSIHSVIT